MRAPVSLAPVWTELRGHAVIRFDQVSKRYESGHEALSQLSFEVGDGEMAFVTGHSGAGKSTLLKLLALIERPSHGQIHLDGQSLGRIGRGGIPKLRRRIGMVKPRIEGAPAVADYALRRGRAFMPWCRPATVNGGPGYVVRPPGRTIGVAAVTVVDGRIRFIDLVLDPAKLTAVR